MTDDDPRAEILARFRDGDDPPSWVFSETAQRAAAHLRDCPELTADLAGEDHLTAVVSCGHGRRVSWRLNRAEP